MKTISRLFLIAGLVSLSACTPSQKNAETQNVTSENQVIETIMSRRSIRKYRQQPVEMEKLQQILDCGINAPNGQNKQSWEIRVVNTPEYISELDSLNRSLALAKGIDASKILTHNGSIKEFRYAEHYKRRHQTVYKKARVLTPESFHGGRDACF